MRGKLVVHYATLFVLTGIYYVCTHQASKWLARNSSSKHHSFEKKKTELKPATTGCCRLLHKYVHLMRYILRCIAML